MITFGDAVPYGPDDVYGPDLPPDMAVNPSTGKSESVTGAFTSVLNSLTGKGGILGPSAPPGFTTNAQGRTVPSVATQISVALASAGTSIANAFSSAKKVITGPSTGPHWYSKPVMGVPLGLLVAAGGLAAAIVLIPPGRATVKNPRRRRRRKSRR